MPRSRTALIAVLLVALLGGAACGSDHKSSPTAANPNAAERNPPGDIPDNQVFVPYTFPGGAFTVSVPEGWSRVEKGGTVTFTDKYNSVALSTTAATAAPTVASATSHELPTIAASAPAYQAGKVSVVKRTGGDAVLITYRADSPPDPVTGKARTLSVERYEFFHGGHEIVVTLSGAKGADNVDPWRIVTDSVRFGA
jgi:hypothetical protein